MGFGEYDGALDGTEKGILLPGTLSRDWLKFFREVIRDRLEQARNGTLHSGFSL
jgi:hypothetical protein